VPPLNRDVAINVCRISSQTTRSCLARFRREAQMRDLRLAKASITRQMNGRRDR
jgi:hypothetical protein